MEVAVFGASGFVGTAIAKALSAAGISVVEFTAPRISSSCHNVASFSGELTGHLSGHNDLVEQLAGMDAVVNAAGIGNAADPWSPELAGANALLPSLIALLTAEAGVGKFLHVSSAAVLGDSDLDSSLNWNPTSPYSRSKALGEELLLSLHRSNLRITIYRPPGVHSAEREVTRKLARLAGSFAATVAGDGSSSSPQSLLPNVADAVRFLLLAESPPSVVAHPWEGQTTSSILKNLSGGRSPVRVPRTIAHLLLTCGRILRVNPAHVRRLEVLWFGQQISQSWLETAGWQATLGENGWAQLGEQVREGEEMSGQKSHPRIVLAVTASMQIPYLGRTPQAFVDDGWDVHVVAGSGPELTSLDGGLTSHALDMVRDPSPWQDTKSTIGWLRLIRKLRPDAVLLGTPKASLLGLFASKILRVPVRTYLLRGLRLETATGVLARILWFLERVAVWSSTEVLAISPSLAERARELGLLGKTSIHVIGSGSSHGVDLERFNSNNAPISIRDDLRKSIGLTTDEFVVGFVGRIRTDKGVPELIEAVRTLNEAAPARLILIGRIEEPELARLLTSDSKPGHVIALDHVENIERYYSLFDVLCLPSHREGFGNVVIEAATIGVPSVVSDATGVRDTVVHEETGLIVGLRKTDEIAKGLNRMRDPAVARRLGTNAQRRAIEQFDDVVVNRQFVAHMNGQVGRNPAGGPLS